MCMPTPTDTFILSPLVGKHAHVHPYPYTHTHTLPLPCGTTPTYTPLLPPHLPWTTKTEDIHVYVKWCIMRIWGLVWYWWTKRWKWGFYECTHTRICVFLINHMHSFFYWLDAPKSPPWLVNSVDKSQKNNAWFLRNMHVLLTCVRVPNCIEIPSLQNKIN